MVRRMKGGLHIQMELEVGEGREMGGGGGGGGVCFLK